MELRPYQLKIESEIYQAWRNGAQYVLVQLHTGGGKTVLFSKFLAEETGASIAIVHRVELVSQISLTLARYGVKHNIIAQKSSIRNIIAVHMSELGRSFYNPQAKVIVAGVDTLVRLKPQDYPWFNKIKLVVHDEGHHLLKNNKWGIAAALFPNARGLSLTATPVRADGQGLGKHADGLIDILIEGPPMRDLIQLGFLTPYRIFAPPSDLDLSNVTLSASGDYSPPKLRSAVHKSHITGDVVTHYLRHAANKSGVTFAVDVEAAVEIANTFREAGVSAEIISSKTPDILRAKIMQRFRAREILQLVNVDLLGEGVDVPAIEVVSLARPTQSFSLYMQQVGRALRPMPGKTHAIIIDHAGNVMRHGLPDRVRTWSLDRQDRKTRNNATDLIALRTCLNPVCLLVYERVKKICPYCGYYTEPTNRSAPEYVDGDLLELTEDVLNRLRGEIKRIDTAAQVPQHLDPIAQRAVANYHLERQQAQLRLRSNIALWAGYQKQLQLEDSEIYRLFYFNFGIDIASAQILGVKDADKLGVKISQQLFSLNIRENHA